MEITRKLLEILLDSLLSCVVQYYWIFLVRVTDIALELLMLRYSIRFVSIQGQILIISLGAMQRNS